MAETFELNFQDLYEIDTTPLSTATYVRLGVGITSATPTMNHVLDETTYLDGEGYGSTDVIGAQFKVAFAGHRVVGNPAQDYIFAKRLELGDELKTHLRYTDAGGNVITANITIANLEEGGGDAGAKKDISFDACGNGKPASSPHTAATALAPTIAAGTALGTTKFTVVPSGTNTLSYKLGAVSLGTVYGSQYVAGDIAYTSGNDIVAAVGQYLQMFEINSYGRVVKFYEKALLSADIKA